MNDLSRTDLFTGSTTKVTLAQVRIGGVGRPRNDTPRSTAMMTTARTRRRAQRDPVARAANRGKVADDAITNLSAYALKLDFEYHRVDDRLRELLKGGASAAEELRALLHEHEELGEARDAFRRSVASLHDLTRREAQPSAP